jgi:hypothetical protein
MNQIFQKLSLPANIVPLPGALIGMYNKASPLDFPSPSARFRASRVSVAAVQFHSVADVALRAC